MFYSCVPIQTHLESIKSSSSKKKYSVSNKDSRIERTTTQLTRIEETSLDAQNDVVDNVSNASNNVSIDDDSDVFETDPMVETSVVQ